MKKITCVYVAGPLNAGAVGYIKNIHRMVMWAEKVRKAGFSVYIPGIDFLAGVIHGDWEYEDYFNNSQPWLERADAIFVIPDYEESKGTLREIERAANLSIPVFYDIEKLIEAVEEYENIGE